MHSLHHGAYILALFIAILAVSRTTDGSMIEDSIGLKMEVTSVTQLEKTGHVVTVLNEEKEMIFGEGVREIGPLTVIEARNGEKTGNFILKSPLALRTTAAVESAASDGGNIIVVGEYEGKIEMCGKRMTIEAKENSIHGNSGFWAEFNVSSLLSPVNPSSASLCPLRARSLRPSASAGGENCKMTDLRVSYIPKAASQPESKPFNFVCAKLTECKVNEVLQDSQSGLGVFIPPASTSMDSSNAADLLSVLFTSDAIKWDVEVMEVQKERSYVSFSGTAPVSAPSPSTSSKIEPYRIWVGGRATPMSSECANVESTICRFSTPSSPSSQPQPLLTIHSKGVWYALVLVSPLDMSCTVHQMFFIPEHSHALGTVAYTLYSSNPSNDVTTVVSLVSQKQSDIFTSSLVSQPLSLSPPATRHLKRSQQAFPPIKPSVTYSVTREGQETYSSIKLPLSHPLLLNDATILHASSFVTAPRKVVLSKRDEQARSLKFNSNEMKSNNDHSNDMKSIKSNKDPLNEMKSNNDHSNDMKSIQSVKADSNPSFTSSGLAISVTMPSKSNAKASFSMIVELVVVPPPSFPSPERIISSLAFNSSLLATIQEKLPSAGGVPSVWIKNTVACASSLESTPRRDHDRLNRHHSIIQSDSARTSILSQEMRDVSEKLEISDKFDISDKLEFSSSDSQTSSSNRSLFAVSLFSSPSKSAYTTFVMTRSVEYEGEVGGSGHSNPPPPPPPPPPAPASPTPSPPTPASTTPAPQSTPSTIPTSSPSSPPSSSTPAPHDTLYETKPMSNTTKWAIIAISFIVISALGYLAYRYYQSRKIAAALRQSVALSSREVTQEDA